MDNTSNINSEKGSTSTIPAIKTSQDTWSLPEGNGSGAVTVDSHVEEGSQGRGSFTQTSQQKNGEFSLAGESKVKVQ